MSDFHEIQTALIKFIEDRPEGNMLRDIAIRALKDINSKNIVSDIPKSTAPRLIMVYGWKRRLVNTVRILPSIEYKKIKPCSTTYTNVSSLTSSANAQ